MVKEHPLWTCGFDLGKDRYMIENALSLFIENKTVTNANTVAKQLHDFARDYYLKKYPEGHIIPVLSAVFLKVFGLTFPLTEISETFIEKLTTFVDDEKDVKDLAEDLENICKEAIDKMTAKLSKLF